MVATIDIRRAAHRFHTRVDWLDSYHSFSFGPHHDPANTRHGLLVVSNDDRIAPGAGFPMHAHRHMEIVTWVLSGRLLHEDTEGNEGEIGPGLAQRMSAGTGIRHSEVNASTYEPLHLVQMWVLPDGEAVAPGYEQRDVTGALDGGGLVAVASGQGHDGAVHLHQRGAVLWVGRLRPHEAVLLPDAPHVHVYVPVGEAQLEEVPLGTGDAARLTAAGARSLAAGAEGAEVLVWEMS